MNASPAKRIKTGLNESRRPASVFGHALFDGQTKTIAFQLRDTLSPAKNSRKTYTNWTRPVSIG
jgi:hypothetical protein